MFNCFPPHVVFQEVPDEVSLAFVISGCPLKCEGCHSKDTWDKTLGSALSNQRFITYVEKYKGMISCVLFFGGEWQSQSLIEKLEIAKTYNLKTCLYTGLERLPKRILANLDYVKLGPWLKQLGGLENKNSNQKFIDVKTGQSLNYRFTATS